MFNRSNLFLVLIIGAVAVPYMMSDEQAATRAKLAGVWDKMFTDTISDRYPDAGRKSAEVLPLASTSPVPGRSAAFPTTSLHAATGMPASYGAVRDTTGRHGGQYPMASLAGVADNYAPQYPTYAATHPGSSMTGQLRATPQAHLTGLPYGATGSHAAPSPPSVANPGAVLAAPAAPGHPLYPNNPLQDMVPERGATEWQTVGTNTPLPGSPPVATHAGGMTTSLPIPFAAPGQPLVSTAPGSKPTGVPDEHGWVTVGPANGAGNPGLIHSTSAPAVLMPAGQSIPPDAMILPARVNPADAGVRSTASNRPEDLQHIPSLFSFDHSPDWVVQRWPRVSTHIVGDGLAGMRVALVSGISHEELAGALTYYFDRKDTLQRIGFEGSTGDPTGLIQFAMDEFQMKPEPALGGGMFVTRDTGRNSSARPGTPDATDDQIRNVLRMRRAPIVRQSRPHQRYLVKFELNRPDSDRSISPEFARVLAMDRQSRRWGNAMDAESIKKRAMDPNDPFSPLSPNEDPSNLDETGRPRGPSSVPTDSQFQHRDVRSAPLRTGRIMSSVRRTQLMRSHNPSTTQPTPTTPMLPTQTTQTAQAAQTAPEKSPSSATRPPQPAPTPRPPATAIPAAQNTPPGVRRAPTTNQPTPPDKAIHCAPGTT